MRPPPTSPPFPYTTLFRSVRMGDTIELHGIEPTFRPEAWEPTDDGARVYRATPGNWPSTGRSATRTVEFWHGDADEDRKSTRLNSSHVAISYAVFCLKKKN